MEILTMSPTRGLFIGLTCGVERIGKDTLLYPLTECCGASGKGAESPTGVVCRKCYKPVDAIFGDGVLLSDSAADCLVEAAAMKNNGGGLPDEGHLYGVTDCPKGCEADEGETCPHGYAAAHDTALALGWITSDDFITDKWQYTP